MTKSNLRESESLWLWFQRNILYHGWEGMGGKRVRKMAGHVGHSHTGNRKQMEAINHYSLPPVMCFSLARLHLLEVPNSATKWDLEFKYMSLWVTFFI